MWHFKSIPQREIPFTIFLAVHFSLYSVIKHILSLSGFKVNNLSFKWKALCITISYFNSEYVAKFTQTYAGSSTLPTGAMLRVLFSIFSIIHVCWFMYLWGLHFNIYTIHLQNIYFAVHKNGYRFYLCEVIKSLSLLVFWYFFSSELHCLLSTVKLHFNFPVFQW